ncbi:MAG: hypothetical protein M1419_00745 [Bacteroidetes bacterium]|nr:hypothetical protein [Bacteroidota bacterium]
MKFFAYLLTIVICFIFILKYDIISQDYPVRSGSIIFLEKKCNSCHSVKTQAIECDDTTNKSITDLSTIGDSLESEIIKDYLKKKVKINNKKHPVAFKGKKDDFDTLCNWLHNLSSVLY